MALLFAASIELFRKMINSMQKTPIVNYIDEVAVPVTDIYFPSISLCQGLIVENKEAKIDLEGMKNRIENGSMDMSNSTT
jgi:hypothetical protein